MSSVVSTIVNNYAYMNISITLSVVGINPCRDVIAPLRHSIRPEEPHMNWLSWVRELIHMQSPKSLLVTS